MPFIPDPAGWQALLAGSLPGPRTRRPGICLLAGRLCLAGRDPINVIKGRPSTTGAGPYGDPRGKPIAGTRRAEAIRGTVPWRKGREGRLRPRALRQTSRCCAGACGAGCCRRSPRRSVRRQQPRLLPPPPSGLARWLNPATAPFISDPGVSTPSHNNGTGRWASFPTWLHNQQPRRDRSGSSLPDIIHSQLFRLGQPHAGFPSATRPPDTQWSVGGGGSSSAFERRSSMAATLTGPKTRTGALSWVDRSDLRPPARRASSVSATSRCGRTRLLLSINQAL